MTRRSEPENRRKLKPTEHLFVPVSVLAACFNTTARSIQREAKAGLLPKPTARGLYDLVACVRRRLELAIEQGDDRGHQTLAEAKKLFWTARARKESIEATELERDLVRTADVRTVFAEAMTTIARGLEALPGRLAADVAGISDPAIIRRRLLEE